MRQIADNVFSLGSRAHNFYMVVDDDEVSIVDAGCVREWSKLMKALEEVALAPEQIAGFLITHVHADHFGMAKRASDEGHRVAVHADDEARALGTYSGRFSAEASDLPVYKPRVLRNFIPMMLAGVTAMPHVDSVETFADGQQLDVPGRPVAVHTPGHTEGHTMFHCPDLGVLFTGDGLVTMDLLGPRTGPQKMNSIFDLDSSMAAASLDRIVDLDANLLLPGHGESWKGTPREAVVVARAL